ncbi:MAG: aminotransferase class IV [Bacteroidetes bacterium]|nr:aminotransferase class IV [Bacteroidota bacterium]MCB0843445.1 aminotransferase class IV [Bacteroidota bacterium]
MLILNGKLLDPGSNEDHFLNRSFKYGDGIFETIRIYQGRVLFIDDHLNRLTEGMKVLQFEFLENEFQKELKEKIEHLKVLNGISNHGRIRIQVYRTGPGAYTPIELSPSYLIEGYSLKTDYFNSDTTVSLTPYQDISLQHNILSPYKTSNALPYVLAGHYADQNGFDDAVLFSDGQVCETAGSNIFIVHNQKIFTPPLSSGCVDGIMRRKIFILANQLKLTCTEKKLKGKDLSQADEIFLTNSLRGITPVHRWKDLLYDTKKYAITSFLKKCFAQFISQNQW